VQGSVASFFMPAGAFYKSRLFCCHFLGRSGDKNAIQQRVFSIFI